MDSRDVQARFFCGSLECRLVSLYQTVRTKSHEQMANLTCISHTGFNVDKNSTIMSILENPYTVSNQDATYRYPAQHVFTSI